MQSLTLVKISRWFSSSVFWTSIVILYLQSVGIETGTALSLISFYSICIVILEYPTGVFGDYVSHKASTILGYTLFGISLLLLTLKGSVLYYATVLILSALGWSFFSGSDNALLHGISKNFKKDYSNIESISIVFRMVAIALGGMIGAVNLRWPFWITAFFQFSAAIILIFVKAGKQEKEEGNIFATAKKGLIYVIKDKGLLNLVLFSGITVGFFISFKWFYNPLFDEAKIPVALWGFIISFVTLAHALGTRVYGKIKNVSMMLGVLVMVLTLVLTGVYMIPLISIVGLTVLFFDRGILDSLLTVKINDRIKSTYRASIFSLKSLIGRLFSSLYLLVSGIILDKSTSLGLMLFSAGLILIVGVVFVRGYNMSRE